MFVHFLEKEKMSQRLPPTHPLPDFLESPLYDFLVNQTMTLQAQLAEKKLQLRTLEFENERLQKKLASAEIQVTQGNLHTMALEVDVSQKETDLFIKILNHEIYRIEHPYRFFF